MLFTWFMLGGFIFLFAPQKLTDRFQLGFAHLFGRPLNIGREISLATRARMATDTVSRTEYNQLLNHLANINEQLNEAYNKIEILSKIRLKPDYERMSFVPGDIITAPDVARTELIINRGKIDGLATDQFVIADNSIIGRISAVSPRTAQVRLFTDLASKIPIKIARLNVDKVMQGTGNNTARIPLLSTKHQVGKGDEVLAFKQPGFLDVPMIIGRVTECKRDEQNPMVWDVTVEPVCDIKELKTITVIVSSP